MSRTKAPSDSRACPRYQLPAMYTFLRLRPSGEDRFRWTGHIYDISASGMRIEVDSPIAPGTPIELRATLPGVQHTTIRAAGKVVRIHDNEAGPARLGLTFEKFSNRSDRERLNEYLASRTAPTAVAAAA